MAKELSSCLAHRVSCSCGQRGNHKCLVVRGVFCVVLSCIQKVGFGLSMPVSTWHGESFSVLIPSPWCALGLMMTQTLVAEEVAEHCFDAIPELGSCSIPLPWLSAGGPWPYLVLVFP